MRQPIAIYIGFDPREIPAFAVTRASLRRHAKSPWPIFGLHLESLRDAGLYTRETSRQDGKLYDVISEAPMATEFAISRFLVPHLSIQKRIPPYGWAVFMDCDMLSRRAIDEMFKEFRSEYAVMCVKHNHVPSNSTKMDGQQQTRYARKNWSSVMAFNLDHVANRKLTPELVNKLPGRNLHAFCWLDDSEIGGLGPEWNWLVGHSEETINPALVHFTDGYPLMPGYENVAFASEWRAELARWVKS